MVKRMLLVAAAAVMFLSTLALPTVANADNGTGSCSNGSVCKP
jgi:hypothetical protein